MQWSASDLFPCFNSQHKNLRSSSITAEPTGSGPLETSGDTVHTPVPFLPPVSLDAAENRYLYPVSYPPGGSFKVMVLGYGVGSWGCHLFGAVTVQGWHITYISYV